MEFMKIQENVFQSNIIRTHKKKRKKEGVSHRSIPIKKTYSYSTILLQTINENKTRHTRRIVIIFDCSLVIPFVTNLNKPSTSPASRTEYRSYTRFA